MTERPIIFSGLMVRAILDGTKTMTRRILSPRYTADVVVWHPDGDGDWIGMDPDTSAEWVLRHYPAGWGAHRHPKIRGVVCPYGQPGAARLWVRETWALDPRAPEGSEVAVYRATDKAAREKSWRPSIYMPRWASRLTLEVVGVRVERLHAITDADILAEGVTVELAREHCPGVQIATPRGAWAACWNRINGKRPGAAWAANPWVWVIEFRRAP